jgi:AcrR family transcriptional regulator
MARTRSTDAHNRVLEAALELFVEKGIEPTTMDALAAASGVSKATIYKHWPEGKEPLLMELLLVIVGIEDDIPEQDTGNLFTDLERVLNDKPRHARPEDQKRLMPQMVAYSAIHQEFGNAWRTRVMERPRKRISRILSAAMSEGRLPSEMDMNVCFALLLGPMMYKHIFGRQMECRSETGQANQSLLGTAKWIPSAAPETPTQPAQTEPELGTSVAEAFCRAFEIRPKPLTR